MLFFSIFCHFLPFFRTLAAFTAKAACVADLGRKVGKHFDAPFFPSLFVVKTESRYSPVCDASMRPGVGEKKVVLL